VSQEVQMEIRIRRLGAGAAVALALACASVPTARQNLDLAQATLTNACNAALSVTETPGVLQPEVAKSVALACMQGGMASLQAQSAYDAIEASGLSGDEKAAKLEQARAAIEVIRSTATRVIAMVAAAQETR